MLATVSSERWQEDPDATIFINGNGDRFQCCLDYIRLGHVYLPPSVSKQAILADLDYYGFDDVDENAIAVCCVIGDCPSYVMKCVEQYKQDLKFYNEKVTQLQKKIEMIEFAHECFKSHVNLSLSGSQAGSPDEEKFSVLLHYTANWRSQDEFHHQQYLKAAKVMNSVDEVFFNLCLAKYGFYYMGRINRENGDFAIKLGLLTDNKPCLGLPTAAQNVP